MEECEKRYLFSNKNDMAFITNEKGKSNDFPFSFV